MVFPPVKLKSMHLMLKSIEHIEILKSNVNITPHLQLFVFTQWNIVLLFQYFNHLLNGMSIAYTNNNTSNVEIIASNVEINASIIEINASIVEINAWHIEIFKSNLIL